jgi:hypothetical protein
MPIGGVGIPLSRESRGTRVGIRHEDGRRRVETPRIPVVLLPRPPDLARERRHSISFRPGSSRFQDYGDSGRVGAGAAAGAASRD